MENKDNAFLVSEQSLRETLDTFPDGFFSFDRDWRVTYVNQQAAKQGAREAGELLGRVIWEVEPALVGSHLETVYRRVMERRQLEEVEFRSQRTGRWVQLRVSPWADGICVYSMDITERKQDELLRQEQDRLLRESEERFQKVWEVSLDAMAISGPDGTVIDANPAYCDLYGYTREEIVGQNFSIIFPEAERAWARQQYLEVFANPMLPPEFESTIQRKDGQERIVESRTAFITEGGQRVAMLSVIRDITEQKQVQLALQESEQRFRAMADGTPVNIWVTNPEGQIEFINRAYSEFFGTTLEELRSGSWTMLVHPADLDSYVEQFVESSQERKPFRSEARVRRQDGQWRWVVSYGQPRFSTNGEFLGMAGSSIDITDLKMGERELKHYAEELERSNQALRDFTSIASHDLQEPLRKITAFGLILDSHFSEALGEEGRDYIERMTSAAERMGEMLHSLLAYSRITTQSEPFMEVDLGRVARNVLSDLEVRLKETGGTVELGELPAIQGDPSQLRQLFQNLISNALKYHRPGKPPHVIVSCQPIRDGQVQLTFQDNGIGLNMKDAHRIFHPFVRLHGRSEYEGTGIGLAICQKIVERHGGSISVESVPGAGSTFRVNLSQKDK